MILAKDKYGRIGRKIPGIGFDAQVAVPHRADHRGDVALSPNRLEADEAYHKQRDQYKIAMQKARAAEARVRREAEHLIQKSRTEKMLREQMRRRQDPEQEALKRYFKKQMGMSEENKVANSLITADFSQSGGDPQILPVGPEYKGVWSADYRKDLVAGNPLSRDGVFGIGTTDYDKIVKGTDIFQWNTVIEQNEKVAGGTMHGVYRDIDKPMLKTMGADDWSLLDLLPSQEQISEFVSDIGQEIYEITDKAIDDLREQLPTELKNLATSELRKLISSGDPRIPPTITVPRYQQAAASGIPQWAIYAGLGMMGLGVLMVAYKAFSK